MRYKKYFLYASILITGYTNAIADTIDHYMNIANGIPQMEIKADPQSQAWARSARMVLTLACDGIAESLILANETAKEHGQPLFCLPASTQIHPEMFSALIQQTYKELTIPQAEKDKMTVSQIALLGLKKQYPCEPATNAQTAVVQKSISALSNTTN
jgi:hypothetical protein